MNQRVNWGVISTANIGWKKVIPAMIKGSNINIMAVASRDMAQAQAMAQDLNIAKAYGSYEAMLADPDIEAVYNPLPNHLHVPLTLAALEAGKHVLCEKPVGLDVEEVEALKRAVISSGKVFQVGHMKRFDAGLQAAKRFIDTEMGEMVALKAWYCDSTHRYAMTDAVQPLVVSSAQARKPAGNPKADLKRYYILGHGCHLIDTARYLGGDIVAVQARLSQRAGLWCWFVDVEFANGTLGHLDLTIAVRMDWHEGFQIYGRNGSIIGKTYNPWFYKSSDVDIFREADGATHRVLGADGHFYRRQLEGFADVILKGAPMEGASIDDGLASVRAMVAIARSVESGRPVALADVSGGL